MVSIITPNNYTIKTIKPHANYHVYLLRFTDITSIVTYCTRTVAVASTLYVHVIETLITKATELESI